MATTKVSELSAKTSLAGSEELLINDSGTSKKVTATNLLSGAVVGTGDITTAKLAADAVTGAKIADNSIDSEHYVDGSIDTAHIADNAITSAKLGVDVIVAEDIANNAITVAELADNAVTTAKILDANVTTAKIADANVTLAKIASEAVDEDNLYISNAGSNGQFLSKQSGNNGGLTWADVDALPSQTSNSGKYLTTDGSTASWAVLNTDGNTTTKGLYEHAHTISANYTITSGNNAMSAGPMTVNSGISVTVPSGSTWVIVE